MRGRRCRSRPPMTGRPGSAATAIDPADVRATLRAAGLRARHALSQNFLADAECPRGDPRRGRARARGPSARDRAGPRAADRRSARGGRAGHRRRARPWARGVPPGAVRRGRSTPGRLDAHRGRRARPGPRPARRRRRTTSSPTCRTTSRARSCMRSSARRPGRGGSCSWSSARSPNGSPRRPGR